MIEIDGLTKDYDSETRALDALTLRVGNGEVCCLLGANGAGKTTTINLLLGFATPSAGTVSVDGINVFEAPMEAKTKLAYLPENVRLYSSLKVRDNLLFFTRLYGLARSPSELEAMLESVGLEPSVLGQRMRTLSKGMRQKVGLAITLAKSAPNLVLDEPLSGLDPDAAATATDLIRQVRDQGRTILLSTHDILRAQEIADRVVILRKGHKILEKTRAELSNADLGKLYLEYMRQDSSPTPHEGLPDDEP